MNGERVPEGDTENASGTSEEPGSAPVDSEGAKKPQWRSWLVAGALSAAIVAAGLAVVSDGGTSDDGTTTGNDTDGQTVGPGGGLGLEGAAGEVTEIDGSTLTIKTIRPFGESSSVSVTTDDDTEVTETADGDVSDLSVGDEVVVVGDETDGVIAAESVSEGVGDIIVEGPTGPDGRFDNEGGLPDDVEPPDGAVVERDLGSSDGGAEGLTAGQITSVDGTTLTLKADDGDSVTVVTDDETSVTVTEARSVDDIEVGDDVFVTAEDGDDPDDGSIAATSIRIVEVDLAASGGTHGLPGDDSPEPEDSTDN